jgi:uncharacterized protein
MKQQPERTCIGCRGVFNKGEVVRIIAGPDGIVIDYREKLPGRAAYVCPRTDCIKKAIIKEHVSKALHVKVRTPSAHEFIEHLTESIREKIKSLIIMAAKAGMLAAGYSAVHDALVKGRLEMLLYAEDLSEGTKEKVAIPDTSFPHATLFSRDALGRLLNRELIGVIGIEDKGFAHAIMKEVERLKVLINISE